MRSEGETRTYRSAAETISALDFEDRKSFQSVIYRIRFAERGAAAAMAYLDTEVAAGDRAEVLRLSAQAA